MSYLETVSMPSHEDAVAERVDAQVWWALNRRRLNETERVVLEGRTVHGMTLEQLARRFLVTRERIRQIEIRAKAKLRNEYRPARWCSVAGCYGWPGKSGVCAHHGPAKVLPYVCPIETHKFTSCGHPRGWVRCKRGAKQPGEMCSGHRSLHTSGRLVVDGKRWRLAETWAL